MTIVPIGQEPDRIEIAQDVYADRAHLHYRISFPYHPRAVEEMRKVASAHWAPEINGWSARVSRHEDIRKALLKIDEILGPERHARKGGAATGRKVKKAASGKLARVLVLVKDCIVAGQVLETRDGYVTVERLGESFVAGPRLARQGLSRQTVRYAYHRPSTEAEIEAHEAAQRSEDPGHEMAP